MTSKTHIATGLATMTALIRPDSTKLLLICLASTTIGSIISDTDLTTSELHKDIDKIITISAISIALCFLADYFFNLGIYSFILNQTNLTHTLVGIVILLLLCLFGMHTAHRSFMHSILGTLIFSATVYFILPTAALPFAIGMFSHIILDLFNLKKVQVFYPSKKRLGFKLCSSDGKVNNILCILSTISFIVLLSII